jgi:hypothetical protein
MIRTKFHQKKFNTEYYKSDYDNFPRFSSYFTQIKLVKLLGKKNILEIGVGNKTVSNYLKNNNFKVTTFDCDLRLKPDYVGDVRKMPFKDKSFDIVLCSQVLEHIPFKYFETSLKEIKRVTKKYAVISIPYSCIRFEITARLQDKILDFLIIIPVFFLKMPNDLEHQWEMGRIGYSKRKIKKIINKVGFKIKKEEHPIFNPYHHFFILEVTGPK